MSRIKKHVWIVLGSVFILIQICILVLSLLNLRSASRSIGELPELTKATSPFVKGDRVVISNGEYCGRHGVVQFVAGNGVCLVDLTFSPVSLFVDEEHLSVEEIAK